MCTCLSVCGYRNMSAVPAQARGLRYPVTVIVCCLPPSVGAGNQAQIIYKSTA